MKIIKKLIVAAVIFNCSIYAKNKFTFIFSSDFIKQYEGECYLKFHEYADSWDLVRFIPCWASKSEITVYTNDNLKKITFEVFSIKSKEPLSEATIDVKKNYGYTYLINWKLKQ